MQVYQKEYIENCKACRNLTSLPFLSAGDFDEAFDAAMKDMRRAGELVSRNTRLLQKQLLPVLDNLYQQDGRTLREMEEFADALSAKPQALDLVLAEQLHEALLSAARHMGGREDVIRELYKLGMVRFDIWNMLTGLHDIPQTGGLSWRFRYCFVEASSYLKYFDDFDEETKGYILRSLANIYLGNFDDWREKLKCVRRTMRVFTDERYRASAPDLPWEQFMYSVHRQMVSVLPYSFPEGNLSPDAVTDVMESAHLIFEVQYEKLRESGKPLHAHRLMPYYSVEFACGLISKEELLNNMERLMDAANPANYDERTNYQIISMPVFYVQYLRRMPELIPPRRQYIIQLYRRMLRYIETMPNEAITDKTQLYVRQTISQFLELEGGVSYESLTLSIMVRFAPTLYAHGYAVGRMAQALCMAILEGEPKFFDDIPAFAALPDGAEKRKAVSEMAFRAGLLHDAGKLNFTSFFDHAGRQMLGREEEILQLHAAAGHHRLMEHDSTRQYADVAYGHHRWYDGSDGYPSDFHRKESPYRAMVDVIAFADYLDSENDDDASFPCRTMPFEDKISEAIKLGGRRFSPLVTAWLRTPELLGQLKELYLNGRREGLALCFHRAEHAET